MIGLIVLFSVSVAASLLWLGGVLFYVYAKLGVPQLLGLPVPELAMLAATAFLPVIFLWMVVGLLYNVMTLRKHENTINLLLAQTRRSADHAEAMARTLMETQVQIRGALVLHNADLFINELNDLLSDIVVRLGVIQPAHTEIVWQRIGDGNRWAFCKVLLQNAENSPKFKDDLENQLKRDDILSNAVRTFCYRFEQMFTMLERHDFEHYLSKIFEEGSLGRVYLRFVEVCREIDREQGIFNQSVSEAFVMSLDDCPADEDASVSETPAYEEALPESEPADFEFAAETKEEDVSKQSGTNEASVPFEFLRPTR